VIKKSTSGYKAFKEQVEEAITETREAIAHADQAIARTRKTLQKAEELHQRMGARREREAEQPRPTYQLPPRPTPPDTKPLPETVPTAEPPTKNEPE
jgi:hypothetical protein